VFDNQFALSLDRIQLQGDCFFSIAQYRNRNSAFCYLRSGVAQGLTEMTQWQCCTLPLDLLLSI
jgi:hypothetical protein